MSEQSENQLPISRRGRHSLSRRISRVVRLGCVMLGIVLLVVSMSAYVYELSINQIHTAFNLAVSTRKIVNRNVNAQELAEQVMEVYYGMTDEERAQDGTEEYYEKFADIEKSGEYRNLRAVLMDFRDTGVADYIYMAVYDRRTHAMIYVADTDIGEDTYCPTGHWEKLEDRELYRFLDWDGESELYDFGDTEKYGYMFTSGVPISGYIGDGKAFILADIKTGSIFRKALWFLLNFTIALILVMALLSIIIVRRMEKAVIDPINKIKTAAKEYVQDKQDHVDNGNHFASLDIGTDDEIESLCSTMGSMESELDDYERDLAAITADKERVVTELQLASRIQSDMLPGSFPAFPDRSDFDIYAVMDPAKEVGGDFYDYFFIDDDRLGIVIADVSGKGIPAALFMMVTKSMLKTALMGGAGAAEALTNVNSQLCTSNHEEMFVTVWAGILDLKTGVITASNAGHEYPMIRKPGGPFEELKDKHGFVLGGIDGLDYKDYQIELEPGSKLFLYTDGAPEATDSNKVLFGMDRLARSVNSAADGTPEEIIKAVRNDIDAFVGEAEQFDDLTMVCVEYTGQEGNFKGAGEKMDKVLFDVVKRAEIPNVTVVTDMVDAELDKLESSMKAQMQINIAIDEIFSNIAKYAYGEEGGDARVIMTVNDSLDEVSLTFIDKGVHYDPMAQEDPDITLPAAQRSIGGLGILLVKKTMNSVKYEYKDGMNCLTIKKSIK